MVYVQVCVRRDSSSCFVNNYNPVLLKSWRANIDLQLVYNCHEAVAYMGVYCSSSEQDTFEGLRQVEREIKTQKLIIRQILHETLRASANARQVSIQKKEY